MDIMMTPPHALAKFRVNPEWASLPLFDRTGWTRVRFGDVVQNCNETCDPVEAGLDRFIAMEHLEPGSLQVSSWGSVSDGTTFTRRCRPGQVLFGRRRAYQRKVAVADFDAVVSGDIYVLTPRDAARLLPELLPFICLSERFFQHAVDTSAGSLSPRTKWDSLASFEFDLPPLDRQCHIASVLDRVVQEQHALRVLAARLEEVRLAVIENFVCGRNARIRATFAWPSKSIGDLCDIGSGKVNSSAAVEDGEYPFFTCAPEVSRASTYSHDCEALLLAGNNARGVYTVKHFKGKFLARQRVYVVRIRDRSEMDYRFLHLMVQRSLGQMQSLSVGTTSKHITLGDLQGVCVPCPRVSEQEVFVGRIRALAEAREGALAGVQKAAALHRCVADLVFAAR